MDGLLKKEFDSYRVRGKPHPFVSKLGIDGVPFAHLELDVWRENFKGIQYFHEPSNFIVTGAIDDLWINSVQELIVVDYKATSTNKDIILDDSEYKKKLKNQIEIYQWLLRQKGFKVSKTGYFVYCNGDESRPDFQGRLEFNISILPHEGNDSWVESTLISIRECLESNQIPDPSEACHFCKYRMAVQQHFVDMDRV